MSRFQWRCLKESDAQEMARLYARCFHTPWEVLFFEEILRATCIAEGVFEDNILCGFILVQLVKTQGDILTFCVEKKYRQQGLGKTLLERAVRYPEMRTCFLEVNANNKSAVSLYKGLGFEKKGVRKGYYKIPDQKPQDAIIYHYSKKESFLQKNT